MCTVCSTVAFHILLIPGKIKCFPLLSRTTSGCSDIGTKGNGNIQECSRTEMCLVHLPLLFILPRRFNKSIFAEVFRHESIRENPIGIRVPCVHAWISNISFFFLHFAISLEIRRHLMFRHLFYLLEISSSKIY